MSTDLKSVVTSLYTSESRISVRFRYILALFDLGTVVFFVVTAPFPATPGLTTSGYLIAAIIVLDLAARLWIADDPATLLRQPYMLADIVVVGSFLADPFYTHSLAFFRVLRGLRFFHAGYLLADLRRDSMFFQKHEDTIFAANNLLIFVLFCSSVVFEFFFKGDGDPYSYIDALYFTVATLTTTGFGDVTLSTPGGKLLSVIIMVVGVALFVQLAKSIFRPAKIKHKCTNCGLLRHETDAVHCKHCGATVLIETSGKT